MEDQKALPYCMAAIHEIQRVGNIGEINFFRETTGEITIAGTLNLDTLVSLT